jgi:methyl-accepting chemotaxis protein
MASKHRRRVKNFFINKNFQGKIILALFLAVAVSGLLFLVVFGLFSADTMTISYENNDLHMGNTPIMLFKKAFVANWVFLVTCATLLFGIALITTHRIAGPLFRFEKALANMVNKNLTDTIRLRGKDEGKDLAQQINLFNTSLSKDLREVNRRSQAIHDLLTQYASLSSSKLSAEEIDSICKAIKTNNDKIHGILSSYKLADD